MQEIAVSFENEGLTLFGMMHLPEGAPPHPCVVILHGYTGNRIGDHCMFVKAARDLCRNGMACMRFDFRGSGESQGEFAKMTFDGEISDAVAAVDFVKDFEGIDPARMGLVGLSLGGAVAVCMAANQRVRSLALWSPTAFVEHLVERGGEVVRDPYAWLPRGFEQTIKRQGHVDIGGFARGKPYFESLKDIDPVREIARYEGPVLLIHGSEDQVVSPLNSELLYDSVKGRRRLIMIDDADHTFSSAQWEKQLIEETRQWFGQTLIDVSGGY